MISSPSTSTKQASHRSFSALSVLSATTFFILTACQSTPAQYEPPAMAGPDAGVQYANTQAKAYPAAQPLRNSQNWHSTWPAIIDASFIQARSLVEKELHVDLADITLQLVDDMPINAEVALETRKLINKQFGDTAFAEQFLDQVMQPLAGTYAALYSSRLESVMISRSMLNSYERSLASDSDQATKNAALLTLLIHELVHAADDKRYNIHDNRALSFRASFAQSATFEGHAQWVTRNICDKAGCSTGLSALDNFMFTSNEHTARHSSPTDAASRNVLEYSYIEGERFITDLARRDNGKQLIDDLLSDPPHDPLQILAPDTYPDTAREQRNQYLLAAGRKVQHPWASPPWINIETSPLKGIDLRSDPVRRQAAIDGFTKLIVGMVSMQFYNQETLGKAPIEATVLQAESSNTARLFATVLHNNSQQSGAQSSDEQLSMSNLTQHQNTPLELHIYRTAVGMGTNYRTAIAVSGIHVVQVSADTRDQALLDDYAIRVLLNLRQAGSDT